ncbi:flavin monoamine oxidase family protein [Rufibacter glacialis]|uniref:FAD-dependent oxidoreductase n=1 Tax=Rufibacter glacialis TaxID=1259555 RepID=A0A5M8QLE9_9BACT|nr:NAD(P)/FAD-dependent oxidoreductase [Rufibacter glacialis]KAA6435800.1 FAD-dependent oxidoreductase [Rufibacter glacialis]GGK66686.1 monoamine oxidase [Rufibacter glacialis]
MHEVMVVGAGLSGLSAAYYLQKKGIRALVLEARERCGGRILTVRAPGNNTPVEMGATWFADKHTYLRQLLQDLNLPTFYQYQKGTGVFETHPAEPPQFFQLPGTEVPSYRVAGGTSAIIEALERQMGQDQIKVNSALAGVVEQRDHLEVRTQQGETFTCRHLILTLPPYLCLAQHLTFEPALPKGLVSVMEQTHTWMGESIKFAVEYQQPFWKQKGYSGSVFSQAGIIQEMYDHSNAEETRFALKGFLSSSASKLEEEQRESAVRKQLVKLLGAEAAHYLSYTEKVWQKEEYTFAEYGRFLMPHQNNGHPLYAQPLMNGKLHVAGSETSPYFGGYLDGAVYSGLAVATKVADSLRKE